MIDFSWEASRTVPPPEAVTYSEKAKEGRINLPSILGAVDV